MSNENPIGNTADNPENVNFGGDDSTYSSLARTSGAILAVSYPLLALSTGVRALYQLFFKAGVTNYLAPSMSGVAALFYLTATIGFSYRRKWAWRLSVAVLGLETLLTLLVGTLSYLYPDVIGHTVWRHFGADYGYFPLFQPILGLVWLFWPVTMRMYGIMESKAKDTPTFAEQS
jgi:hypothetical protein